MATLTSCTSESTVETITQATVTISDVEALSTSSITATFTPSANCAKFAYAIGASSDRAAFLDGSLAGIETTTIGGEIIFEGLEAASTFTVYAIAYDADGAQGPLASVAVRSESAECNAEVLFAGAGTAGVSITANSYVYRVDYALGEPGQAASFDDGSMDDIKSLSEISSKAINYFDLEQDTEYSFYYKYYDRLDNVSETIELTIATGNPESVPFVELEHGQCNIMESWYTFKPNDLCQKYHFLVGGDGEWSEVYDSDGWGGDIYSMMISWAPYESDGWGVYTQYEEHEFYLTTLDMYSTVAMEFYVLAYDKDGVAGPLQQFKFSTEPEIDETLVGTPSIEITIDAVTSYSMSCTITPSDNTFGVFYTVYSKYWFDYYDWLGEYYDDLLYQFQTDYSTYGDDVFTLGNEAFEYSEPYGLDANTEYYVVAVPINGAGLDTDGAWGAVVCAEFTTANF